jgi:hypothetical protein
LSSSQTALVRVLERSDFVSAGKIGNPVKSSELFK